MEVSAQLHAPPVLPPGKSPRYPFDRRLGGPQSRSIRKKGNKQGLILWCLVDRFSSGNTCYSSVQNFLLAHLIPVGFEVFTAVTMKNAVFWDVAPCRCGRLNRRSAATCSRWFFARGYFYPEDGGDTILRNVSSSPSYTWCINVNYNFNKLTASREVLLRNP
jgi:hypothetical protein